MSIDKYIASCRRGEHPTLDEAKTDGRIDAMSCQLIDPMTGGVQ